MKIKHQLLFSLVIICLLNLAATAQLKIIYAKDKFAKFGDIKVHYQDQGKGKNALIFIHGWTCNMNFWKGQFTGFAGKRVIFIDLPGHGKSDKPQTAYTLEYFARSIEAVLRDAKVKKAVLVGHSMGTPVIRNFYKLYPEKILGLVIVDGSLKPFASKEMAQRMLAPLKANYKQTAPGFIDQMVNNAKAELRGEIRAYMLATPDYVAISAMESLVDENSYPKEKVDVPVLAICAEATFGTADNEKYLRTVVPDLEFNSWKNVSHFLMMEEPQKFNQTINTFLTSKKLL